MFMTLILLLIVKYFLFDYSVHNSVSVVEQNQNLSVNISGLLLYMYTLTFPNTISIGPTEGFASARITHYKPQSDFKAELYFKKNPFL